MTSAMAPVLGRLIDGRGHTAADWAIAPLADAAWPLEVVPDGAALLLAVDGERVRAAADRLPLRANAVDGLCLVAVLAGAPELDVLFAEVRRVLRPAGTLVVVSPSAAVRSPGQLRLRALHRRGWANRSGLDDVGWLLAAADFAVMADDRVAFTVDVPNAGATALAAELSSSGLWPPRPPAAAVSGLAATGGGRWPVPLRRLVARR